MRHNLLEKLILMLQILGIDLLTIAGHKLYAPKGIGALYIKQGTKVENLCMVQVRKEESDLGQRT